MNHIKFSTITLSSILFLLSGCSHVNIGVTTSYTDKQLIEGQTTDQLYQKGRILFSQNRHMDALKYFKAAYYIDPKSLRILNGLASVYDNIKRFDLSKKYYYRALLISPKSVITLNNMGYSYLLQDNIELAIYYFRHAENSDPSNIQVQNNLARAENEYENQILARNANIFSPRDSSQQSGPKSGPKSAVMASLAPPASARKIPIKENYRDEITQTTLPEAPKRSVGYQLSLKKAAPRPEVSPPTVLAKDTRKKAQNTAETRLLISRPGPDVDLNARNPVIEFSNGAGRRGLASRIRKFAKHNKIKVQRLTNADHYSHMKSTIYYQPGWGSEAGMLARLFPIHVAIAEETDQRASLRLEIGGDLLDFDKQLINEFK